MANVRLDLSSEIIRGYCRAHGFPVPPEGRGFVWAFRNAVPVPGHSQTVELREGTTDHWDDTVGLGGTVWRMYQGTTDPGRPFTVDPLNTKGAAWLIPWTWKYRLGRHKSLFVNALVQAEPVKVRRDRDRDGRPEYGEDVETGWFGIHVHKGGSVFRPVGPWSAGCIVVPREFWDLFWGAIIATGQKEWTVTLIDARLFHAWWETVGG